MRRISGAQYWRARYYPRSISKEHSASSAAIYSMDRSICGKCSRRVLCWATQIIGVQSRGSICAARELIREAASLARPATMPLAKSCAILGVSALPGHDSGADQQEPRSRSGVEPQRRMLLELLSLVNWPERTHPDPVRLRRSRAICLRAEAVHLFDCDR